MQHGKVPLSKTVQSQMTLFHVALANVKYVHLPIPARPFWLQNHSFSSGTISHASLPTSFTASLVVNVAFFRSEQQEDR